MDWMLDASIEICNTLVRLEANGRDLSATECKNIIAKHYAAQQSVHRTAGGVCENCGNNCWKLVCETCGAE